MRTISKAAALTAAIVLAACAKDAKKADSDLSADLKAAGASLDLANQQNGAKYAATETAPKATPEQGKKLVRSAGPKAIQSPTPTVAAAPEPEVAAVTEIPQVQVVDAVASNVSTVESVPAVPRPVPTTGGYGDLGGGNGAMGEGSGVYGGGGGPRVVIRGGGIGDRDHCLPGEGARGPQFPGRTSGGIYVPNTMGGILVNRPIPQSTGPMAPRTGGSAAGGRTGTPRRGGR